jgi:hypothetical protein
MLIHEKRGKISSFCPFLRCAHSPLFSCWWLTVYDEEEEGGGCVEWLKNCVPVPACRQAKQTWRPRRKKRGKTKGPPPRGAGCGSISVFLAYTPHLARIDV